MSDRESHFDMPLQGVTVKDVCDMLNDIHRKVVAENERLREKNDALRKALAAILADPHGCRFCDSGKLRNPNKPHDDTCGFALAAAIELNLPKCKTCHGRGSIIRSQQHDECEIEEWEDTCPTCDGTGRAELNAPQVPADEALDKLVEWERNEGHFITADAITVLRQHLLRSQTAEADVAALLIRAERAETERDAIKRDYAELVASRCERDDELVAERDALHKAIEHIHLATIVNEGETPREHLTLIRNLAQSAIAAAKK